MWWSPERSATSSTALAALCSCSPLTAPSSSERLSAVMLGGCARLSTPGLIGCHGRTNALTTRRDRADDCLGDRALLSRELWRRVSACSRRLNRARRQPEGGA